MPERCEAVQVSCSCHALEGLESLSGVHDMYANYTIQIGDFAVLEIHDRTVFWIGAERLQIQIHAGLGTMSSEMRLSLCRDEVA